MQSLMQKTEPPIRFLADVNSNMSFAEFLTEMDSANLRETRIYFSSGAISENIGLSRNTYMLYLNRITSTTSTVLAFPLTNSKNFYKLNKSSSTWGSWITINNDNLETQVGTNTTDIATLDHNRSMSKTYTITPSDVEFTYFVYMVSSQVSITEVNFCTCNGLVHMEVTGTTTEAFNIGAPIKVLTFRQPPTPDTVFRSLYPKNTLSSGIASFPANYVNPQSTGFIRNDGLYFINESNSQQPTGTSFKVSVDYFCDTAINLSNIENNYGT